MNIYVASSWKNLLQLTIVTLLRSHKHHVYDFRHPAPGNEGFNWRAIDPDWQSWTPAQYREALQHPIAQRGFAYDMEALKACDACVLVLPSGRSASWEFGWAIGAGKQGAIVMYDACEPELMYRGQPILTTPDELQAWATAPPLPPAAPTEHVEWTFPLGAKVRYTPLPIPTWSAVPWRIIGRHCREQFWVAPWQQYSLELWAPVPGWALPKHVHSVAVHDLTLWEQQP